MKSLLQEAPSIERAISQAWESAGRPQEFSVKIHEQGKRGFLGFSSKPAVVSITYKPLGAAGQPVASSSRGAKNAPGRNEQGSSERRGGLDRAERGENSERSERSDRNDRRRSGDRRDAGRRSDRQAGASAGRARGLLSYVEGEEKDSQSPFETMSLSAHVDAMERAALNETSFSSSSDENGAGDAWEASYVDSVKGWLNEIISTIGYDVTFEPTVNGKVLHLQFVRDFVEDAELSRSLYASLSFLLLQFLKREHKRRFRGLRIALTHPGQELSRFDLGS